MESRVLQGELIRTRCRLGLARDEILARGQEVVRIESAALGLLADTLNGDFVSACEMILEVPRQLVVTGMGKSGLIARKVAATFAATGTPAVFVHPGEAAHGDLGMLAQGDVLLVLSNSGNTHELRAILNYARANRIPIIGAASRRHSQVIKLADVALLLPHVPEACAVNVAPTTSTTLQLALGDALAMAVMDMRGISKSRLHMLHPGGHIGLALTPVGEIMRGVEYMPLVHAAAAMPETLSVMTSGCFGLAGVTDDDGVLLGVITDGDLRRKFSALATATAAEVMTPYPKLIPMEMAAKDALAFLNSNQITAAFVIDEASDGPIRPLGIIHIHDLLRFELF